MPTSKLADALLKWYKLYARPLPWRVEADAYHVWISEIMLQQTRVETVTGFYERWMNHFPDLQAVAKANMQDVLKIWEGLGYYTRARNIKKTADLLHSQYDGQFPQTVCELEKLPGIGKSTAGAIASIAFNQTAPILDGNVKRVIARIFRFQEPVNDPKNQSVLWEYTERLLPNEETGLFNQALMELGETVCLINIPNCSVCPIQTFCQARKEGVQRQLPIRLARRAQVPEYIVVAAVIKKNGKYLITQRPMKKLLGGLWEFPGGKLEKGESLQQALSREIKEELQVEIKIGNETGVYRHAYTHFKVIVHAFECQLKCGKLKATEAPQIAWVRLDQFESYPMGKVDRMIAGNVIASAR